MDAAMVRQQPLLRRVVEIRAVVDGRLRAGRPAEHLGLPRVQVRVEVHHRHRPVRPPHAAQQRQRDGVVAAQRDQPRQRAPRGREAARARRRGRRARQQRVVAFFDLLDGVGVVVAVWARG